MTMVRYPLPITNAMLALANQNVAQAALRCQLDI